MDMCLVKVRIEVLGDFGLSGWDFADLFGFLLFVVLFSFL